MPSLKEIKKNLQIISTIKTIVNTYQEIANLKMRQIKEIVLKNREFTQELIKTYQRIKGVYFKLVEEKKYKKIAFRKIEKEKAIVFLSANQHFYGSLILDIWKEIQKIINKEDGDLIIVGNVGRYLAEKAKMKVNVFYFQLDDEKPEKEKIAEIIDFIKKYERIIVFHGKYEKGLVQKPVMSEISGFSFPEKKQREVVKYLFEPSPEAILEFFETEIVTVLFNITILEHQLARYVARVMAMQEATEKAKDLEKMLKRLENKLKREIINKKQIELLSALKI